MYAYKSFLSQDLILSPFIVNKGFHFEGGQITSSGIDIFIGKNITGSFYHQEQSQSGYLSSQYNKLVYDSIKFQFYSNYSSSDLGDPAFLRVLIPGKDAAGDRYVGPINTPNHNNSLQTTLIYPRHLPSTSGPYPDLLVLSIPEVLYGDNIQPGSVKITSSGSSYYQIMDDGEGNLMNNTDIVGSVFYSQGLINIVPPISGSTDDGGHYINFFEIFRNINVVNGGIVTGSVMTCSLLIRDYPNIGINNPFLFYVSSVVTGSNIIGFPSGSTYFNWHQNYIYPKLTASLALTNYTVTSVLNTTSSYMDSFANANGISASFFLGFNSTYSGSTGSWSSGTPNNGVVIVYPGLGGSYTTGYTRNRFTVVVNDLSDLISTLSCSFSSSYTINETQYKCTIKDHEFNFSLNPSLIRNGTTGSVSDFVTGSNFVPYITTIGLYDDNKELLAVAKLAQPLPMSSTTDSSIIINIDR